MANLKLVEPKLPTREPDVLAETGETTLCIKASINRLEATDKHLAYLRNVIEVATTLITAIALAHVSGAKLVPAIALPAPEG